MRKLFFLSCVLLGVINLNAQKVTLKAGTIVPLRATQQVKAADVEEGQTVDFAVMQDVNVDGKCVIPQGTLVKGRVSEARKSTIAGTKGRLVITIDRMNLSDGEPIFFSNTAVRINGQNRTPLAVGLGIFVWPCIFIPGTKAVMPAGYEVQAIIAANKDIEL